MTFSNKTRKIIIDISEALFSKHGWQRVSISKICLEADVSRVTFYRYFQNKNDLLQQVFILQHERIEAFYQKLLEESTTLEAIMKGIFNYQQTALNRFFTPDILKDIDQNNDPELSEFFDNNRERKYRFLNSFFTELQSRKIIDANYPTILIHSFLKIMDELMFSTQIQTYYKDDKSGLRRDVLKLIMFGLAGPTKS